jgi:hypothetical protein
VVQVQALGNHCRRPRMLFSCDTVSQVVLRPKLSIPLINYFVSILATVMVRWSNHGGSLNQLRNDESAASDKRNEKNVHMIDCKYQLKSPFNFANPFSALFRVF